MKLYLDDNSADAALVASLRNAGHHVTIPSEVGISGVTDARHFEFAIKNKLVVFTADREDFLDMHDLILAAQGNHSGILVIRFDNDAKRDMKTKDIVRAIRKVETAAIPLESELITLNHWR